MLAVIAVVFLPEGFIWSVIDGAEWCLMDQNKTFFTDDLHRFFSAQNTALYFRRKNFLILPCAAYDITVIVCIDPCDRCLNPILDYCHSYRLSPSPSMTPLCSRSASFSRLPTPTASSGQPITRQSPANCHNMSPASFCSSLSKAKISKSSSC